MNTKRLMTAPLGALAVLACTAHADTYRRSLQDHEVVIDKELLVTALEVVDSVLTRYPGPWSFGHMMDEAFGVKEAPTAVREWLIGWAEGTQPKSGDERLTEGRPGVRELISTWQTLDRYSGDDESWIPNFENAPFRLLAIANRMDLSTSAGGSGGGAYQSSNDIDSGAGEGRFVYAAIDTAGQPLEATFILEYALDGGATGEQERTMEWAMAWHQLGDFPDHGPAYRGQLAKLTRCFTDRRLQTTAPDLEEEVPTKKVLGVEIPFEPASLLEKKVPTPDQAALEARQRSLLAVSKMSMLERLSVATLPRLTQLIRLRTAERAFGEHLEFRQWNAEAVTLTPAPLPGTPRDVFFKKGSRENRFLARWLRQQRGASSLITTVPEEEDDVPTSFTLPRSIMVEKKSHPIEAMRAQAPDGDEEYHWKGRGLNDDEMRLSFSTQTCVGCHVGDTNTASFHILPRKAGEAAALSKFLRTDGTRWRAKDPASNHTFVSSEMDDRKLLFEGILNPDLLYGKIVKIKAKRSGRGH